MLGTLMKYEFKAVGRLLLPLYGAWLIAAVMLGLSIGEINAAGSPLFITLSGILYGGFTMVSVVLTCIILIQRFYKNLLGNEGYLMFALPVSTGKHLINKTFSGAVWGTVGIIVAALSGIIIAGCIEGFQSIWENFHFMAGDFNIMMEREPSIVLVLFEILLLVFLAFASTAAKVYAAIAVGHQWSNHRVFGAILAYIGFGIIESVIANIFARIADGGIVNSYFNATANMSDIGQTHLMMLLLIIGSAIVAAIYGVVSWLLLDNRLNLE